MQILIVGSESAAVQQAAAVARQCQPQWDVRLCRDSRQFQASGDSGSPTVVMWDVELGSPVHLVTDTQDGAVVIVWGAPERLEQMASALRNGASRCLPRHEGWEELLPAMLEQATRSALTAQSRADEQRAVDVLGGVQEALSQALEEAVFVVNPGGLVIQMNAAAERLTGQTPERLLGSRLSMLIDDDPVVQLLVAYGSTPVADWALPEGAPDCVQVDGEAGIVVRTRLRHREGGHLVDVQMRCRAVSTPAGLTQGLVLVPKVVPAGGDLRGRGSSVDLLSAALDVLPLPLVIVTVDGAILHTSPAFARLVGWSGPGRLGGKHLRQVLAYPDALLGMLQTAQDAGVPQVRDEALRPLNSERTQCLVTAVPVPWADELGCVVVTFEPTPETSRPGSAVPVVTEGLQLLKRVVEQVDGARGMRSVLDAMVSGLVRTLPVDAALVVAEYPGGELLHSSHGFSQGAHEPIATALLGEMRRAHRSPELTPLPEHVTDAYALDDATSLRALYVEEKIRSVCHVPVVTAEGTLVGGMVTCSRTPRTHDERLCALLSVAAGHLAHAVWRERVQQLSDRAADFQEKLLAVSLALNAGNDIDQLLELIANTALDIVAGDYCCVEVLDEDQQFEKSYAAARPDAEGSALELRSSPLAWQAVQTGEIALARGDAESNAGPSAGAVTIAVPLMLDFSAIGALSVRRRGAVTFDDGETNGLRALAAQAAVAIQSTRLYEVARRRSQHMEVVAAQAWQEEGRARALFEVATAVTERTDLQEILAVVTRSACTEIGFERAQIYLADHENQTLVGRLRAAADAEPTPMSEPPVPLRRDSHNRLAEAALGSAPYMIDLVEDVSGPEVRHYERVFVPLVTQEMLVGLIVADNPVSGDPVSPHQTRLLRPLASLASVAIERARVEKLRGTIISSVSHELRAPLASIRAYNELVMTGDVGEVNQEQVTYLERVDKACRHLERVIADLMNLSKLRSGEVSICLAPTDLNSVVCAVLDTLRPRAKQAAVQLIFDEPGPLPETMTDHVRLAQVLTNLVDNAIKFNEPNGWVRLGLGIRGDRAIITVADNGPGIPRSQQSTIFEEFVHGTDDRSRAKDGAGLGLAIARRVIEVLGGKLWVDSEVSQGSTFYVELPMEPTEAPD